jgi:hypothetical protein
MLRRATGGMAAAAARAPHLASGSTQGCVGARGRAAGARAPSRRSRLESDEMLALTTRCTISALALLLLLAVDTSSSSSSVISLGSKLGDRLHAPAAAGAGGSKPHLVFLFCDNVGWANVGFHRTAPTPEVVTPNIDELVRRTDDQPPVLHLRLHTSMVHVILQHMPVKRVRVWLLEHWLCRRLDLVWSSIATYETLHFCPVLSLIWISASLP